MRLIDDEELLRQLNQGYRGRHLAVALGLKPSQESTVRLAIKRLGLDLATFPKATQRARAEQPPLPPAKLHAERRAQPTAFRPTQFRDLADKTSVWVLAGPDAWQRAEQVDMAIKTGDESIIQTVTGDPLSVLDGCQPPLVVTPKTQAVPDWWQRLILASPETLFVNIERAGELAASHLLELAALAQSQAPRAEIRINGHRPDPKLLQAHMPNEPQQPGCRLSLSRGYAGFDATQSYAIKNYLPENSLAAVYGPSGSYKSFLALSWACHIATGKSWNGNRVIPGSVLYVVGEGGIGVPRRIKAWAELHHHGLDIGCLYRVNCPVFFADPSQVDELEQAARRIETETGQPLRLIVVDTLARCFGGGDENRAADMGAFIQGCDRVKASIGATVLVVHHSGKNEDAGARGSTAFRAALDAEFLVKREGQGGALVLRCTKAKDCEEPLTQAFDLRSQTLFTDEDGEEITSLVLLDQGREPVETAAEELAGTANLSPNHTTLWQAICRRTEQGSACTKALIRDDLKARGIETKNWLRWLDKLVAEQVVLVDGETIRPISQREVTH